MGMDSIWHWAILLTVVLLIFGTGKLAKMGPDIGNAVKGFKQALHGSEQQDVKQGADVIEAAASLSSGAAQAAKDDAGSRPG
ncbi:Sec-independent protein translocase subunit TatA [Dyella jejuensis]|uniref:Sec-independent protein translocase protein TatA n=1 Tax=Dyella jejuensis TaxID=1432009 RepID=A0ABW8JJG2_9GAMM